MSVMPFLLHFEHPHRIIDQDFGSTITPDDLLMMAAVAPLLSQDYYRPWRQQAAANRDVGSTIKLDKDKFQLSLDVQHFAPEDISVKIADGYIVIEGKHEEKKDEHGFISRQFTRRYALPDGCDTETVESKLSSDGVLIVTAPRKSEISNSERVVPIAQTGPVRKEIKDQHSQANGE